MEETRRFKFTLDEAKSGRGVVKLIGRASRTDRSRFARMDNLFFDEKSLSKNHAMLGLKLLDPLEQGIHIIDQFRIYIKDLGSTYGMVDLNSQESDPFVIDLKNGERFGLVNLDEPISTYQRRAAKLKFQVNIQYCDAKRGIFECLVKDVSFDDSPMVTRPSTYGEDVHFYHMLSCEDSNSTSSSEWNYSEEYSVLPIPMSNEYSEEDGISDSFDSSDFTKDENDSEDDDDDEDQDEDQNGDEDENYTFINLYALSQQVDNWDIWKSQESENHEKGSQGLQNPRQRGSKRPLNDNEEEYAVKASHKKVKANGTDIRGKKDVIISGLVGLTIGCLGTLGLLIGLANKME